MLLAARESSIDDRYHGIAMSEEALRVHTAEHVRLFPWKRCCCVDNPHILDSDCVSSVSHRGKSVVLKLSIDFAFFGR
jgi:hypothetical protein